MGIKHYKPTSAAAAAGAFPTSWSAPTRARTAPRRRSCRPFPRRAGATTTASSRRASAAAATSGCTARSTSSASATTSRPRFLSVEYDPNRSARIALVEYPKDEKFETTKYYILAPNGLKAGDKVMSGETDAVEPKLGNCLPLWKIPTGMVVHNVELTPGRGGQICRSAGLLGHTECSREGLGAV